MEEARRRLQAAPKANEDRARKRREERDAAAAAKAGQPAVNKSMSPNVSVVAVFKSSPPPDPSVRAPNKPSLLVTLSWMSKLCKLKMDTTSVFKVVPTTK